MFRRHHLKRASLFTAAAVVALVFFVLGAVARLLLGPISLGPFAGELGDSISAALPGLAVRYDGAALQWSRDEGRVNLVVLGARVFDRNQRIVAQAPKAEVDLAAAPLLSGKIVVRQITLVGVQLTLVHTMEGSLRLGVERGNAGSDVLERLRKALASTRGTSALKSFAIRHARLAFYDERTGLFVVAPEAGLQITTDTTGHHAGTIVATVNAQIEISGHRAHVVADLRLPNDEDTVAGDVSIRGLDLNALGENSKALAFLKPYTLKTDVSGSFVLDRNTTHVRYADFGLGAAGAVSGFGHPITVKSLRLVGRYDGRTGRLLIDDGSLAGNEASAHLSGDGNLTFDSSGGLVEGDVDLTMDKIAVDMPGVMQQAVKLTRVALRAAYTPADNRIMINRLLFTGGPLSATFAGRVTLSPGQTPEIDVQGHVAPIPVADLLHYWPLRMGVGARDWISENVSAGTIGPVSIKTNIAAGVLDAPVLPNDAIDISFPLQGGTVTYVKGLTPLTDLAGNATLSGDTFSATVSAAKIGPLAVSGGKVMIPNLHIAGSPGDITAHVDGALGDVLSLIDMKPLRYPSRFHIGTDSAKGMASLDLDFKVPMKKDLNVDQLGVSITGQVSGLALAVGDHKVSDGTVNLAIDNSSLDVSGKVKLAGAMLNAEWKEAFSTKNPITTHITANGVLSDAARTKLNFHSGPYLKGPVNIAASLEGHRGSISSATMTMELTPATVTLDLINYRKPPGVAAAVQVDAQFKAGAIKNENILLSGAGLNAKGTAAFGPGGKLQRLEFPVVRAGPDNDFALAMTELPEQGLKVTITGHSADGTGLGRTELTGNKAPDNTKPKTEPFLIQANLERLVMRKGVTMAPFAFRASGIGDRPQSMALTGTLSKTARLSGDLVMHDGEREIRLTTNNAGLLMRGLFGFTSMRGGKMNLTAALSPKPTKQELADKRIPDYRGALKISDFTVIHQPFLTRLFSAGSLGGLIDLLGGKGIAIDQLDAPFVMHAGVLDIHDARANGPSIGITAEGYLDRRNNKVALEGALAPIYGLNSVLGAIPILGDVLVSKKGEGIIGMSYSVSGNPEKPEISVNPLSVLTPGILRRIFEGTPKAPLAAELKPAKPATKENREETSTAKPETAPPPAGKKTTKPGAGAAPPPPAQTTGRPKPKQGTNPPAVRQTKPEGTSAPPAAKATSQPPPTAPKPSPSSQPKASSTATPPTGTTDAHKATEKAKAPAAVKPEGVSAPPADTKKQQQPKATAPQTKPDATPVETDKPAKDGTNAATAKPKDERATSQPAATPATDAPPQPATPPKEE